jgi:hypothetical protein
VAIAAEWDLFLIRLSVGSPLTWWTSSGHLLPGARTRQPASSMRSSPAKSGPLRNRLHPRFSQLTTDFRKPCDAIAPPLSKGRVGEGVSGFL